MKSEKALKVVKETSFRNNFYCNVPLGQCWTKIMHIYDVKTAIELAEQEAEERMRKELTRWNDPKVILPPPDIQVIIKLKYKNGRICYAAARFSRKEGLWFYNQYSVCGVESIIGWREIHE